MDIVHVILMLFSLIVMFMTIRSIYLESKACLIGDIKIRLMILNQKYDLLLIKRKNEDYEVINSIIKEISNYSINAKYTIKLMNKKKYREVLEEKLVDELLRCDEEVINVIKYAINIKKDILKLKSPWLFVILQFKYYLQMLNTSRGTDQKKVKFISKEFNIFSFETFKINEGLLT